MKLVSKLFPIKPDGSFEAEIPDHATILEWDPCASLVRIVYELRDPFPTPEW